MTYEYLFKWFWRALTLGWLLLFLNNLLNSHFSFVLNEALKNNVDIETSSAFDLEILSKLNQEGKFNTDKYIICNGFKNTIPVDFRGSTNQ